MATEAQVDANRLNAQKSTGPKTEEGKRASSQNALKHGIRATELAYPGDFSNEAEGFIETIEQEFDPQTTFEETLVARLSDEPLVVSFLVRNERFRDLGIAAVHP